MENKLIAFFLSSFIIMQSALTPLGVNALEAEKKPVFKEDFVGDVGTDFMQYDENKTGNDYFTGGFLVEGTSTPWRDNRFEIIGVGEEHAIKRSYSTNTLANVPQRPTRTLKNPITLNPEQTTVYYIKWKQYLGENDGFYLMQIPTSGSAVNFDALMLDLGMRAGAGFAANSDGKTVPFISYYTGDSNIVFGTNEILPGVWYNMILKIEASSDSSDKMSLAIYPETEEFNGEYQLTKEYNSSISYSKVSYHFRASNSKEQKADMAISGAVCEAYDLQEAESEELVNKAKQSVYVNSSTAKADLISAKEKVDTLESGILKSILNCKIAELDTRNSIFAELDRFAENLDVKNYESALTVAEASSAQYKSEYMAIINQYKDLYDVVVKITGAQTKQELENIDLSVINDDNLKKKLSTLIAERTAVILTETAEHDKTKEKIDEAVQAVAALEEGTLKNQLTEKLNLLIQDIAGEYAEQYLQKAEESKKLSDAEQSKLWIDSVSDVALKAALADRYAKLMQFIDSTIPKIGDITIKGDAIIGGTLIAEFTYSENECENDKGPIFKWYRDNVLIAQTKNYTVTADDLGKTLKAEITPVNNADKIGNAAFAEILIPQNINVCYEDFDYEPNTPVKNIRELNSADALKGFSGGWLIGSKADIGSAKQIENEAVVVTDHNTISIPGNSTNYYMRKMQQPIKADGDDCYYISWLMSGFIPASAGTQSQKLEFGTSDGEYTPIMIGMIHQNGADNLIPFIKVNNMGIVYGSESIEPNKIYRFAAMIKMTGDKDAISLKVYPLEGTPKSKWDATISVALNPAVLDRLNFTCNNGDASYNVEYGDLKVQRYSRESMDIFEKLSAELAKAEEEYNEQMLAEVKERLNEMVDGICRSELTERISKLESKIEIEKNTRVKIEQVITALENTDITESKYNEIMEECKSVEELINLLYSVDSKNNYLSKLNEIYSKLYYVEISKNSITDDFSTYQDGQVLSDDWFLDNELTQSANAIEVVNGCVNLTQNSIFRKIPEVDLNLYTWYMDADYSGDNAEFQIGDMNIKVSNDRISCVLNEESVCETGFKSNGKLILEADNEGMFIRNSEEELYIEWQKEQIIKLGVMKGSIIKKLTCQSVRKEINDDIRNAVSAAQSLQYGDILFAQSRVACLPETIIKFVYSQKTEYLLEENKKLIPKITSIAVSGSDYSGGMLKLSYIMEDRGQNKAEPKIEWRYGAQILTDSDVFKIPSNTSGTVTVTVTPKNLFGIEGIPSSKSVSIKNTNVYSGGGGGGGGGSVSTPVKKPAVTDKPNAAPEYIFLDITNHWAKASIEDLYSKGIVKGVENEFFYPDKSVTRAEFAQMISNIIDCEDNNHVYFSDVHANDWYYRAIERVALCGIMIGSNQKFNPNDEITREEIAVASYRLFRYLNCSSEVGEAIEFADKSEISLWAVDFVDNCSKIRMMSGMDNNCFMPKKTATRAEAATIICRILNCN